MNYDEQNFDFPYQTYPFLIKYVQLNAPDVYLEKGLTRVSAIIKELTQSVYRKCTTTWVYLYMDA